MQSDTEKRWMVFFYAVCGAVVGTLIGFMLGHILVDWMKDGVALIILCAFCGGLLGVKVGERRILP